MTSLKLFKLFFHQLGSTIKLEITLCHLLTAPQSLLWCEEDEEEDSDGGGDEDTDNIIIFNCRCRADYPLANAATTANAVNPTQVRLPQELCECGGGGVPALQEQDQLRHLLLPPHGGLGGPALGKPGTVDQRGPKRPIQKEIFVSKCQTP